MTAYIARHLILSKRSKLLTLAAALGFGLVSCSDGAERNYNVPTSLCGVSITAASLTPVLPAGEKVSQKSVSPADGVKRCQVSVDSKIVLVAGQEWWSDKPNLRQIAQGQAYVELEQFSDDGNYIYSGRGAVAKVKCAEPMRPENELFTVIQVPEPGRADATAVKKIITAFTTALSSSDQCTRDS
ncbi:hypothetical protein [Streptomyces sp. NRRL S-15]|uniref:hypothetical protein n=1 Tax=Streptomyces sp. NRRL S-15 TaxID=1463886 RepID=UPI00131BD696|nr:hypothetical protein [Streptomyces sp. NRRL S-15]